MTKEQAIALFNTNWWEPLSHEERAMFQLFEPLLCMPFAVFHEAVEKALNRPVWTHEFGVNLDGLKRELLGERAAPTLNENYGSHPGRQTHSPRGRLMSQLASDEIDYFALALSYLRGEKRSPAPAECIRAVAEVYEARVADLQKANVLLLHAIAEMRLSLEDLRSTIDDREEFIRVLTRIERPH